LEALSSNTVVTTGGNEEENGNICKAMF
jgi:hypothetical protein